MAVLQAYQADLNGHNSMEGIGPEAVAELRCLTDLSLRTLRHLRLKLSGTGDKDKYKVSLLDTCLAAQFMPSPTGFMRRSTKRQCSPSSFPVVSSSLALAKLAKKERF